MDNYFYTSIESIPDSNLESIRFKNYVDYDDYLKMSDSIKVNILEIIKRDKKKISSKISFILLSDIGNTVLHSNISEESIIDVLESL